MRRRYRSTVAAYVALGTAAVAVATVLVTLIRDDRADGPLLPTSGVLTPDDAALAVAGADFEVVDEVAAEDGVDSMQLLPDGRLLVLDIEVEDGFDHYFYLDVLDPSSGERARLPAPWHEDGPETEISTALDGDRLTVSWSTRRDGRSGPRAMVLDLSTGAHVVHGPADVPHEPGSRYLSALHPDGSGRLYVLTGKRMCGDGECMDPTQSQLWSYDPAGPTASELEVEPVEWDVSGDLLAWVEDGEAGTVHLRDLETDDETAHAIAGCDVEDLTLSPSLVVATCEGGKQPRVVLDASLRPLVKLVVSGPVVSVTERWVIVDVFAYDTRTGRLLRLSDGNLWSTFALAASGDLVVTPLGVADPRAVGPDDQYDEWAVVRLSDREDSAGEVGGRASAPFVCWDGRAARHEDECGWPHGSKGMAWMFPDSAADRCREAHPGSRRLRETWCRDVETDGAGTVDLHFSEWKLPRSPERHYGTERLGRLPEPHPGARAFAVRSDHGAKGVVRYSGRFTDIWAVAVYADSRADLVAAIADMRVRPPIEFVGMATSDG